MRLRAHTTVFLFGVAVTILALVALMAAGVVPVKTTQTPVVGKGGGAPTSRTPPVAAAPASGSPGAGPARRPRRRSSS